MARAQLATVQKELGTDVILFSSLAKKGLDETRAILGQWLCL